MLLERFALSDRVAIVTGAGRGIGKGIALGFADVGAHVAVAARTPSDIENTAAEIRAMGRRALAIPTDVCIAEQVENMVQRTVDEFGRIDILVNNAGGTLFAGPFDSWSEELWDGVIALNLKSHFLCSKAVAKVMMDQKKGCIIGLSSLTGRLATPYLAPYAASKAAIANLTQTLAYELAPYGIRVNAISPGKVLTATTGLKWSTPEIQAEEAKDVFLGRIGMPEDVALLAIFLASDAASWITGETFSITGGAGLLALL